MQLLDSQEGRKEFRWWDLTSIVKRIQNQRELLEEVDTVVIAEE